MFYILCSVKIFLFKAKLKILIIRNRSKILAVAAFFLSSAAETVQ